MQIKTLRSALRKFGNHDPNQDALTLENASPQVLEDTAFILDKLLSSPIQKLSLNNPTRVYVSALIRQAHYKAFKK